MRRRRRRSAAALLVAALGWTCASVGGRPPGEPFDVQGHRGARGLLPENTLPGFARALELGVSTLELDVGVSADGVVVVTHDRRLKPEVCLGPGGSRLPAGGGPLVRELTAAELAAYDCGSLNPEPRRFPEPPRRNLPGTPIPTLDAVLALAAERDPGVRLNVEIKHDPTVDETVALAPFVDAVLAAVRRRGAAERTTIQSFDWRALALVKERAPEQRTAALLSPRTVRGAGGASPWLNGLELAPGGSLLELLDSARGWTDVFSPHWRLVLPGAHGYLGTPVAEIQAAGFPVVPWTVNSPRRMRRILALGVDGLITDYPGRLVALLAERGVEVL